MARKSKITENRQPYAIVTRYAGRHAEFKRIIAAPDISPEECVEAMRELRRQL